MQALCWTHIPENHLVLNAIATKNNGFTYKVNGIYIIYRI